MSTDCENLLKKFLVLNPARRASLEVNWINFIPYSLKILVSAHFITYSLQVIMKDKWMNMGYEEEDLKPYVEPVQDWNDRKRIEILEGMGYSNSMVEDALTQQKFDDCYASYLLLGRRNTEVSWKTSSS